MWTRDCAGTAIQRRLTFVNFLTKQKLQLCLFYLLVLFLLKGGCFLRWHQSLYITLVLILYEEAPGNSWSYFRKPLQHHQHLKKVHLYLKWLPVLMLITPTLHRPLKIVHLKWKQQKKKLYLTWNRSFPLTKKIVIFHRMWCCRHWDRNNFHWRQRLLLLHQSFVIRVQTR